ncbi:MAG TPA: cyclopropane fatty acyl phospholipid synthase [Kofleriaceae bacterium]|jgi:cyclopropane-fatty-acyl-phospholipid synthase
MDSETASIASPTPRVSDQLIGYAKRISARRARDRLCTVFAESDIRIDNDLPWSPKVIDERVFGRVLKGGMVAAGESYVDGDWDCVALDELSARFNRLGLDQRIGSIGRGVADAMGSLIVNRQRTRAAVANGRSHYDRGDDLYAAMLGETMVYSCGYWRGATSLDEAQRTKLELVCGKLELRERQSVLDVGCGYGELARHAAVNHGAHVVGTTISRNQADHARRRCAGLPVRIEEQDYRNLHGRFDRIVSVGMFEHVGPKNYERFFTQMRRLLAPDGLFLLHTIGHAGDKQSLDPWLERYIFPGAVLPTARGLADALEGKFVIEDWQNLGADYDRTLLAWFANFDRAWPSLQHYGDRFYRAWRYYLLSSAGSFRARRNHVWQLVLSPHGHQNGYRRPLI